jgi:hypothetical protein
MNILNFFFALFASEKVFKAMNTSIFFFPKKPFTKRSRKTTVHEPLRGACAGLCPAHETAWTDTVRKINIDEIPQDILIYLLKKSPNSVTFIMQFVCKKWNDLIKNNDDTKWVTEVISFIKGTNTIKDFSDCLIGLKLPMFKMIPHLLSPFDLEYKCAFLSIKHDNKNLFLNLCKEIVYSMNVGWEGNINNIWENNNLCSNLGMVYIPKWIGIYGKTCFLQILNENCWNFIHNIKKGILFGHVNKEYYDIASEIYFKYCIIACEYDFQAIINWFTLKCAFKFFNTNQLYNLIVKCIEKNSLNCIIEIISDESIGKDKELFTIIIKKQSLDFLLKIIKMDTNNHINTIKKYKDFLIKETKNEEIINYLKKL